MTQESVRPVQSRRSYQQELVPSKQRDQIKEKRHGKRKDSSTPPTEPAAPPPPPSTQPVTPPSNGTAPTSSLAERYVAQYEKNSGTVLTSEQRAAKVSEIETFYGENSRQGRLEKIVFA